MSYGELTLPPVWNGVNKQTGKFLKGHVPYNKGKKWSDYMGKRAIKRCMRGWANLDKYRNINGRADVSGRCRKQVIAVMDDGSFKVFSYAGEAAECLGGNTRNITRCCLQNQRKKICKNDWRPHQKKGASRINTDHRYNGVRYYYESDNIWTTKIKQ